MKTAMKAKDKETLQVIRMLKASIQNEQIKKGSDLNEEEELTVLSREMKQRRDSLNEFEKADRNDLAEKVKVEIAVVEKYLPAQLDEAEIRQIVAGAIEKTGASSSKEFHHIQRSDHIRGTDIDASFDQLLQSPNHGLCLFSGFSFSYDLDQLTTSVNDRSCGVFNNFDVLIVGT